MDNQAYLKGILIERFTKSHVKRGKVYYKSKIMVIRESGVADAIPVISSEKPKIKEGTFVEADGEVRTWNDHGKLHMYVYVSKIKPSFGHDNRIILNGVICKKPIFRKTPLGREIADVILAVSRRSNKMDYIPCIIWGKGARMASEMNAGQGITISGRFQMREYKKRTDEGDEIRIAYEISVEKCEKM